jgi:hypothetical protein
MSLSARPVVDRVPAEAATAGYMTSSENPPSYKSAACMTGPSLDRAHVEGGLILAVQPEQQGKTTQAAESHPGRPAAICPSY